MKATSLHLKQYESYMLEKNISSGIGFSLLKKYIYILHECYAPTRFLYKGVGKSHLPTIHGESHYINKKEKS